jgi:hypothetical protein
METVSEPLDAWVRVVARALRQRWPSIGRSDLEAQAAELWHDEQLRQLPPEEAAAAWLKPIQRDTH